MNFLLTLNFDQSEESANGAIASEIFKGLKFANTDNNSKFIQLVVHVPKDLHPKTAKKIKYTIKIFVLFTKFPLLSSKITENIIEKRRIFSFTIVVCQLF